MKEFASKYNFIHTTSSPHYPQSNGLAERTVKTVKKLIADSPDPHLALLSYRSTPLPWCELSPAELLMGRRLQTDIPQTKKQLIPKWLHIKYFPEMDKKYKREQKRHYNRRHRVRETSSLPDDNPVWVNTQGSPRKGVSALRCSQILTGKHTIWRGEEEPKPPQGTSREPRG